MIKLRQLLVGHMVCISHLIDMRACRFARTFGGMAKMN